MVKTHLMDDEEQNINIDQLGNRWLEGVQYWFALPQTLQVDLGRVHGLALELKVHKPLNRGRILDVDGEYSSWDQDQWVPTEPGTFLALFKYGYGRPYIVFDNGELYPYPVVWAEIAHGETPLGAGDGLMLMFSFIKGKKPINRSSAGALYPAISLDLSRPRYAIKPSHIPNSFLGVAFFGPFTPKHIEYMRSMENMMETGDVQSVLDAINATHQQGKSSL